MITSPWRPSMKRHAADGSCPLEQIADASGIAVGGTVLQMSRDMSRMKILLTHSRSLTPAQQRWPPLIQEAYAQLEVKRATRKVFGTIRTLCWTDHANLTRAQTSDIGVDSKIGALGLGDPFGWFRNPESQWKISAIGGWFQQKP